MINYFDFEKPIEEIDEKIKTLSVNREINLTEINKLENDKKNKFVKIYSTLNSWQKVQVARHSKRPHALDYINNIFVLLLGILGAQT